MLELKTLGRGFPAIRGRLGRFSPALLFANDEEGAWFDPSDLSTLFQDSAGTTPVTTAGQPVGKMLDKSGRGNHATQATSAARPTYQTGAGLHWLAFDGVGDYMDGTGGWAVDAEITMMVGGSTTSNSENAGFIAINPSSTVGRSQRSLGLRDANSLKVDNRGINVIVSHNMSDVAVLEAAFTTSQVKGAVNGGGFTTNSNTSGDTTTDFVVGKGLTGIELPCDIYGIFIINRDLNSIERSNLVSYSAEKSGVTL
jgi:hypothetical protein